MSNYHIGDIVRIISPGTDYHNLTAKISHLTERVVELEITSPFHRGHRIQRYHNSIYLECEIDRLTEADNISSSAIAHRVEAPNFTRTDFGESQEALRTIGNIAANMSWTRR